MGDKNAEPFLRVLDEHFPHSPKVTSFFFFFSPPQTQANYLFLQFGVVGSSTPFVNGNPYSLFLGHQVLPHGVVGLAVLGKSHPAVSGMIFADGTTLGPTMEISKARGNIVLTVDGEGNPTRQLLAAIEERGFAAKKDEQFFIRSFLSKEGEDPDEALVHKITSGDPSKGLISVDTVRDIPIGTKIQVRVFCPFLGVFFSHLSSSVIVPGHPHFYYSCKRS